MSKSHDPLICLWRPSRCTVRPRRTCRSGLSVSPGWSSPRCSVKPLSLVVVGSRLHDPFVQRYSLIEGAVAPANTDWNHTPQNSKVRKKVWRNANFPYMPADASVLSDQIGQCHLVVTHFLLLMPYADEFSTRPAFQPRRRVG